MSQLQTEWTDTLSGFKFKRITPNCNHYAVYPEPTIYPNNAVTMTGSDVAIQIRVPFAHRLNRIEICHLDSTLTPSADALDVDFSNLNGTEFLTQLRTTLLKITASADTSIIATFGEAYENEQKTWTLTLKSTAGHKVIPVIYLQLVGSGGYT